MTLVLRLIWLIGLAALIVGSLAPAQSGVMHLIDLGGINDKVEHFTAYAVLAALPNLQSFRCRRIGTWSALQPRPDLRLARPPGEHLRYPGRPGPGAHSPEVHFQFSSQWTALTTFRSRPRTPLPRHDHR